MELNPYLVFINNSFSIQLVKKFLNLIDMIWYLSDNNSQLLLVIHSPNIITLWNTQTGTKVWRVVYDQERQRDTEAFLQIIQDPFNHQRAIGKFNF
jgi:hypothetical protein